MTRSTVERLFGFGGTPATSGGEVPPQRPGGGSNDPRSNNILVVLTYLIADAKEALAGETVAFTLSAAGSSASLQVPAYLVLVILLALLWGYRRRS